MLELLVVLRTLKKKLKKNRLSRKIKTIERNHAFVFDHQIEETHSKNN